ncbi:radical SAM protein [Desulforhopalus singaporensis]|uniref:Wyosine [tRNA(Phe)-imidazoG37] synthetase, radical SAM superfamily n=1 Tax=Desulforhopalus singaporensis TaxID=91360 RepID=A0A1H0TMS0_9BACT|nr:radical SAM protein [Desulforhopalus singaporensis]SDP55055.1 Wyosine [tRNA(Phe)-imidazoG37] synthetase, radical SAM superfamily [Desulforhopalus singaporensis]
MNSIRVFGPVPSRRLGRSIGVNNIPPKICSYSCVYCQLGASLKMTAEREQFYDPYDLLSEVKKKIASVAINNQSADYLTLVSDGEPTLDQNLGTLIELMKPLGFRIAVITNATLLNDPEVRKDLGDADWVSVKVDTLDEKIWKKIDRPHRKIAFASMLDGIRLFSREYRGTLVTETMLVRDLNSDMAKVAQFIKTLCPSTAYLSVPTRPPAQKWVKAPTEKELNKAYQIFREASLDAEYLIGYEGGDFAFTGNVKEDLLSIISVHPMREDAVRAYLQKADCSFSLIEEMLQENKIIVSDYNNKRFYLRRLKSAV